MLQDKVSNAGDHRSAHEALGNTRSELAQLFKAQLFKDSPAGPIPAGRSRGTALLSTGSAASRWLALTTRILFWQGKNFDAERSDLLNRLSPLGLPMIRAVVREEPSLIDERPCIVLDYSTTSIVAKFIRDEIRQVAPDNYLGLVFVKGHQLPLYFWLDFSRSH